MTRKTIKNLLTALSVVAVLFVSRMEVSAQAKTMSNQLVVASDQLDLTPPTEHHIKRIWMVQTLIQKPLPLGSGTPSNRHQDVLHTTSQPWWSADHGVTMVPSLYAWLGTSAGAIPRTDDVVVVASSAEQQLADPPISIRARRLLWVRQTEIWETKFLG